MSDDFKSRLKTGYLTDDAWTHVRTTILNEQQRREAIPQDERDEITPLGISFFMKEDLIYCKDKARGFERLCIPESMVHEVFKSAHDDSHHQGFHHSYERLVTSVYIRKMARTLRKSRYQKLTKATFIPPTGFLTLL